MNACLGVKPDMFGFPVCVRILWLFQYSTNRSSWRIFVLDVMTKCLEKPMPQPFNFSWPSAEEYLRKSNRPFEKLRNFSFHIWSSKIVQESSKAGVEDQVR